MPNQNLQIPAFSIGNTGATWNANTLIDCDPYLVWADASTLRGRVPKTWRSVLIELSDRGRTAFLSWINNRPGNLQFVARCKADSHTGFLTGVASPMAIAALVADVSGQKSHALRFTIEESRRVQQAKLLANANDRLDKKLKNPPIDFLSSAASADRASEVAGASDESASSVFLGIIDDGLPAQLALSVPNLYLWDQGWWPSDGTEPPNGLGPAPSPPSFWRSAFYAEGSISDPRFRFGRRTETSAVALANGVGAGAYAADASAYAAMNFHTPAPRHMHGSGVLGLMVPSLCDTRTPAKLPNHVSGLAMVQLPSRSVFDTTGGALAAAVVDAVQFILWQEADDRTSMPDMGSAPRATVLNLSYGLQAGPHDGSSMLERALKAYLNRYTHLRLVLPAGNGHLAGSHWQSKIAPTTTQTGSLRVLPDNAWDTFVELWLPKDAKAEVTVTAPDGATLTVRQGDALRSMVGSAISFALIYPPSVAQSDRAKTMLLLAIAATRPARVSNLTGVTGRARSSVASVAGMWCVSIKNLGEQAFLADMWVERGDTAPDSPTKPRQAYFPSWSHSPQAHVTTEGSLNGMATFVHDRLRVVGAMSTDARISLYSASGGAGVQTPSAVVTADWSRAVPGVRTSGFLTGVVSRINGTSAPCGVFSRRWALELAGATPPAVPIAINATPMQEQTTERPALASTAARGQSVRYGHDYRVGFYP